MKRFVTAVLLLLSASILLAQSDSEIRTLIGKADLIGELRVSFTADFDVLPVQLKEGSIRTITFYYRTAGRLKDGRTVLKVYGIK